MYEIRERATALIRARYYDHEVASILQIEYSLDEFQAEDLTIVIPKWRAAL
jgi:hypothetical protein